MTTKQARVHFVSDTTSPSLERSRPVRRKSTIPKFRCPRAYAIKLPWEDILRRAAERDPALLELLKGQPTSKLRWTIEDEAISLCERARAIWPKAFVPVLDDKGFSTCLDCLGFADNTHPDHSHLPSEEEIQEIRDLLDLNGEQYRLGWFKEPDPTFRTLW